MRILTRAQFLKQPSGTVFHYFKPNIFDGLLIKTSGGDDTIDFCVQDLIGSIEASGSEEFSENCQKLEDGFSVPLDFDSSGREGMFDDKQLFAVFDDKDVDALISVLAKRKTLWAEGKS